MASNLQYKRAKGGPMKNFLVKLAAFTVLASLLFAPFLSVEAYAENKAEAKKININTASLADLQQLPRVGPKIAQRIIDFRTEHGKFKKVEEIMKVKGIGEKTFERLKELITVGEAGKAK